MADENWQKVREIFDSALSRKPEERPQYLIEICGTDKSLLAEVESLLDSLDSAESFLEKPAVTKIADTSRKNAKKFKKGDNLGHYEIIRRIGTGGMGEVYSAKDKNLDRRVAIKILNEEFSGHKSNLNRFIREAKAASLLNHPNILTIHEIGAAGDTRYIVSEYIKGKTLREILRQSLLKLAEILDISIQIANALAAAHEAHLVHRDIKPENIMIRPDGFVKVLDFGLAKLVRRENKSALGLDEEITNQTAKGVILGTINYMSPEQVKGEQVDERTDIFSLGAVIFEMISGKTPFQGTSSVETLANLINREPPPLSQFAANVPEKLQSIISKMICKNTNERYFSMEDVLADLRNLRENPSSGKNLERLTAATENESTTAILQSITENLNKTTVKTSQSFSQRLKNRKWFTAFPFLVILLTGLIFWSFKQSTSAHDLYLQGRFYAVRENRADNDKAIELLEQAVALDPKNALAYTELARAYGTRFFQLEPHQKQWQEKAYVALDKAFAINPNLAEAHEIRGFLLWMPANHFPHEQAIAAYRKASELNPNLDEPHQQLGKIYLHIGLLNEAVTELRKALELNPGNTMARYRIGIVLIHQGKYEEARRNLKSTPPEINPAIVGRDTVWLLISLGERKQADSLLAELIEKYPTDEGGQFAAFKAFLAATDGNVEKAESEIRDALEKGKGFGHFHHTAYIIACAYAALGKPEEAMRFLQMTADEGYPCYPLFEKDAKLDRIRSFPKFQTFLAAQKRQWEYYKSLPQL